MEAEQFNKSAGDAQAQKLKSQVERLEQQIAESTGAHKAGELERQREREREREGLVNLSQETEQSMGSRDTAEGERERERDLPLSRLPSPI